MPRIWLEYVVEIRRMSADFMLVVISDCLECKLPHENFVQNSELLILSVFFMSLVILSQFMVLCSSEQPFTLLISY